MLVTMTEYDSALACRIDFASQNIETTLAREISLSHLRQVHIAETEKFAHATYFLNGGVKELYQGEEHILIDSRKDVKTHDLAPEMKAQEIADKVIEKAKEGIEYIFVNFANADMVGHTGILEAAVKAADVKDEAAVKAVDVAADAEKVAAEKKAKAEKKAAAKKAKAAKKAAAKKAAAEKAAAEKAAEVPAAK
jgi:2,3-bisphosphoglycerate-independent phosphoglycerate mutase